MKDVGEKQKTLSRLGYEGEEITGYFRGMTAGLLDKFDCCAAGGAIVDYLNNGAVSEGGDIDVFLFDGEKDFKKVKSCLLSRGYGVQHEADHATLFVPPRVREGVPHNRAEGGAVTLDGRTVSMPSLHVVHADIKTKGSYRNPAGVLGTFDLASAQAAVTAKKTCVTKAFLRSMDTGTVFVDINNRRAVERALSTWFSTVCRMAKYALNKGFERIDESFFEFLERAASYYDPDDEASAHLLSEMSFAQPVAPPFCQNPLLTLSEIGYKGNLWSRGGNADWGKEEATPWRERYSNSSDFRSVVNDAQKFFRESVYPGFHTVILAGLVIRSGLKFPTELLERKHNGFFCEKLLHELAWTIYAETGSNIKNFTTPYDIERHFSFPDFNPADMSGEPLPSFVSEEAERANPVLPAPARSNTFVLHQMGMINAAVRVIEQKIREGDYEGVAEAFGVEGGHSRGYPAGGDISLLGVPWGDMTRPINTRDKFTLADSALLTLSEESFCRLVDLGAVPGKYVKRDLLSFENYLVRTAKFAAPPGVTGNKVRERVEKWERMKSYADEQGYWGRGEDYRKDRNEKIMSGEWARNLSLSPDSSPEEEKSAPESASVMTLELG